MQQTVLLTLGRLPKALDIAAALSSAGWRVIVAEPFNWHLCKVSRFIAKSFRVTAPNTDQKQYLDDLLEIIKNEDVSLVLPVSEEALHATFIEPSLPKHVRLFSVPQDQLQQLHDKFRFNRLAASFNLAVPETHLLGTVEAEKLAAGKGYILKPSCTCSGQGLSLHEKGDKLPKTTNLPETVVQQKMTGALKSSFSIVHRGRVLGSVVYRAVILSGTVAVAFERLEGENQIESWIKRFAAEIDYNGFLSFDMMEDEIGTPHAIECNPRATSGIHFVERESLASAILRPETQTQFKLKPHMVMQQFFPCLTETQTAFFRRDHFIQKAKILFSAKDVNFAWTDPLPLWLMPFTSWEIMRRSFLEGQSFGEASTFDIAWYS